MAPLRLRLSYNLPLISKFGPVQGTAIVETCGPVFVNGAMLHRFKSETVEGERA
jgi:hypothetical protein